MLEILAQVVEEPILIEMKSSQAISLEVDESTDVSIIRQLDVHVRYGNIYLVRCQNPINPGSWTVNTKYLPMLFLRYLDKEGHVLNQFLDLVAIADGKANTVVNAIKDVMLKKGLPTEKLYGLGTDGAAVMTGNYVMPMWDYVVCCIPCLSLNHFI